MPQPEGAFDPTVQPLWLATATGGDTVAASGLVGWNRVRRSVSEIRLEPRMQLTFNGIAQGHAADRVAALMRDEGFTDVLIDMGEIAALGQRPAGGGWTVGIAKPDGTITGHATLSDRALATSSPWARSSVKDCRTFLPQRAVRRCGTSHRYRLRAPHWRMRSRRLSASWTAAPSMQHSPGFRTQGWKPWPDIATAD